LTAVVCVPHSSVKVEVGEVVEIDGIESVEVLRHSLLCIGGDVCAIDGHVEIHRHVFEGRGTRVELVFKNSHIVAVVIGDLTLTSTGNVSFLISLYTILWLAGILSFGTMEEAPESIGWGCLSASTMLHNIEAFG
jgi:hypothetical protein